jgi:hypothetical protein
VEGDVERKVEGTNLSWSNLAQWLDLVERVGGILRASSEHYRRVERLYRSLTLADLRTETDAAALAKAQQLFDRGRYNDVPVRGLRRVFDRAEIGRYLVEATNQLDRVRSGRALKPRAKGPRFDLTRLPDAALGRLIQSHPDLELVERLRAERRRRDAPAVLASPDGLAPRTKPVQLALPLF